ncbi:MAG: hypothetical protein N2748_05665 [candidate division WOR-3 bacterium]|nr:hypothetical protein [candidate division WOR-3 bacterium]
MINYFDNYFRRYDNIKLQVAVKKIIISQNIAKCYLCVYISGYNIYYGNSDFINQPLIITLRKHGKNYLVIGAEKINYDGINL